MRGLPHLVINGGGGDDEALVPLALGVFWQKLLFRQNDGGRRHSGVHLHLIGTFGVPSEGPDDGLRRLGSDLQISIALPSPAPRRVF